MKPKSRSFEPGDCGWLIVATSFETYIEAARSIQNMFQRCISLLVIAGLFAGQLAAIPHAHGGISAADQQRHDAKPHFHVGCHVHGDHDHGHSHDQQRIEEESNPSDNSDGRSLTDGPSGPRHDASAIFAPMQAGAPSITSQEGSATTLQLAAFVPPTVGLADRWPSVSSTPRWHPPDEVLDASDTYLTLRNLRI